jgi:uncharacterized protein (TIGR02145 family)
MKNLLLLAVFVTFILSSNAQTITDIDGNVYNTVTIGTQTWMKENLKTTKLNDGTTIPLVTDSAEWSNLTTPGYCWYDNDSATYASPYGTLYNWFTVDTASNGGKNVCPTIWHVPTDAEWTTLTTYLGGDSEAGGKLKEINTTHWYGPNTGADNSSGYTALPGGYRDGSYTFFNVGKGGYWWSSSENGTEYAWYLGLHYNSSNVDRDGNRKNNGFSVRCLKDNNASLTNSLNSESVILYPNPATEKLYFKNSNYANTIIMIFDMQGKQVLSEQIDSNPIDISNLSKGIYVVKLVGSGNVLITKFIKE